MGSVLLLGKKVRIDNSGQPLVSVHTIDVLTTRDSDLVLSLYSPTLASSKKKSFLILHISDTTQYFSLCVWFISLLSKCPQGLSLLLQMVGFLSFFMAK